MSMTSIIIALFGAWMLFFDGFSTLFGGAA